MSKEIEERVVEMRFDNQQFEAHAKESISTLERLEKSLNLRGASKGLEEVEIAAKRCTLTPLSSSLDSVKASFSALEVVAVTALANITNSAVNAGKRLVSSLTVDQVTAGWDKYENKMAAVQTIMAATRKQFEDEGVQMAYVNEQLEKINWFTDETSYKYMDMVNNIGKFTNNNVALDRAVTAMIGIADAAALAGVNAETAGHAMEGFSKAIGTGFMARNNWQWVKTARMDTVQIKESLLQAAEAAGTLVRNGDGYATVAKKTAVSVANFEEALSEGWMTTEVILDALSSYGGFAEELYRVTEATGLQTQTVLDAIDEYREGTLDMNALLRQTETSAEDLAAMLDRLTDSTYELAERSFRAGQETKTLSDAIGYVQEAVSTGWMTTFELLFGDYEEAVDLFSNLSEVLYKVFVVGGEARNEVLGEWKQAGGRVVLLEAVIQAFENLCAIIKPVKEAFREIFPAMTAKRLYAITVGLRNFLATLMISAETADKLKRTFAGLFAVVDVVGSLMGGVTYAVFNALGRVISSLDLDILGFTANLGDALVSLRAWIEEHDIFTRGLEALVEILQAAIPAARNFFQQFFSLPQVQVNLEKLRSVFRSVFNGIGSYLNGGKEQLIAFFNRIQALDSLSLENITGILKDFRDNVVRYFLNFGGAFSGVEGAISNLGNSLSTFFGAAKDKAKTAFENIADFMLNFKESLFKTATEIRSSLADKIGFAEIFAIGIGTSLVVFVKKISDALTILASPIKGIGSALSGVSNVLNAYAKKLKASEEKFMTFAKAILMLVAALTVLTLLDQEKLKSALVILGVLSASLLAISFVVSKIGNKGADLDKLSASLMAFGASLFLLAVAIKQIEGIGAGASFKGVAVITALGAGLLAVSKFLGSEKEKFYSGSLFLLSFAVALRILVGALAKVAALDIKSAGKTVTLLLGAMAGLALVAAACKNVKFGAAATVLSVVVSLSVLIRCFDQLAKIDIGKARANLGAFIAIFSSFALLMVASKFAGENAAKAGTAIVRMSAGLLMIMAAFKLMEGIEPLTLERSAKVIAQLFVVFGAVTALSHFAGENAAKAGTMVLEMAGAILLLSASIVILAHLDSGGVNQALGVIVALQAMFGVLIGLTHFAKDVNATVIALTVAISAMVAAVAALSMIDQQKLLNATAGITVLITTFALLVASTNLAKKAYGVLVVMAVVVAGLAGILFAMSVLNVQSAIQNASGLGILLVSLSTAMLILSKAGKIAPAAYGALAIMLIITAGIGAILGIMSHFNIEASIKNAAAISLLLLAMSGACFILSAVGATGPAAFIGIGALATLIVGVGGIMAAICALTADNPTVEEDLDRAIMVMEKIGTGLGAALGGFVGGALGGLTSGLPIIGENLSGFMENAQPFFDAVRGIDTDAMSGVKSLAETLLILTGTNVVEGLTSWLTGGTSLADFGEDLIPFGENFAEYAKAVENINPEVVTASANAAKTLAEFAKAIPNSGGLVAVFAGENSLSAFAAELIPFGESFAQYAETIGNVKPEVVTASANAAKSLAEFANMLPNQGGLLADLVGDNTLSSFAEELERFGPSLKNYADSVTGLDAGVVENSANAASALAEMAGRLPNSGGVLAYWVGDNSLSSFAEELEKFGPSLMAYASSVENLNPEVVTASASAASALSELANGLPNTGGILAAWMGDSSLSGFGEQLISFGDSLAQYSLAVKDIQPEVVTASANAATALSELATKLPAVSVFDQWFGGQQTLSEFGEEIASFGDSMGSYYAKISNVDPQRLSTAVTNVWGLVDLAKETKGLDTSGFTSFGAALTSMGDAGLTGFTAAFTNSESAVQGAVGSMLNYAKTAISTNTPSFQTEMRNAGTTVATAAVNAVNAKHPEFVTAGSYLASGFAQGIRNNVGTVTQAATSMADASADATRKTLKIASPSKVFQAIAGFLVGGFATGIKNNMPEAIDMAGLLGTSVTDSIQAILDPASFDLGSSFSNNIASGIKNTKTPEEIAKEKAQAIVDTFKKELDKLDLDMSTKDLELSLWKATIGQSSADNDISYAELETLEEKIVLQQETVNVAYREFQETVKEFGDSSEEAQEAYNKYLQEQIELAELQNEIAAQNKAILDRSYQFSMDWIEEQKYYGKMTLSDELAAYKRVQSRYAKGTEERKKMDREVYSLEKEIYEAQKQYVDDIQNVYDSFFKQRDALEDEYAAKEKSINKQLEEDIKRVNESYENAVKSRAQSLYDSYGLFDEVAEREEVSGETLMKNLQGQVAEFQEWQDVLGNLSARGVDAELVEELQEMGPSSIAQIKALEAMTDDELDKYVGLWGVKHAIAREQATSELEDLRLDTYKQINQLRADADQELSEYQSDWQRRMDELNNTVRDELARLREEFGKKVGLIRTDTETEMKEMAKTAQEILTTTGWDATGKAIVDGITNGVTDNTSSFLDALTEMALAGVNAVNETLGINSPSRVFWETGNYAGMGFVNGLHEYTAQSYEAGSEMGETARDGLADAISHIGDVVYGEEDGDFVIRPILDLSDIQNGVGTIDGMLASASDLSLAGRITARALTSGKSGSTTVTVKNDDVVRELRQMREDMADLGDRVSKLQVVLDSGALVGEIAEPMDYALGQRAIFKGRRV